MLMTQQDQTSLRRDECHASSCFALPLKEIRSLSATGFVLLLLIQPSTHGQENRPWFRGPNAPVADAQKKKSIEEKARRSSTQGGRAGLTITSVELIPAELSHN